MRPFPRGALCVVMRVNAVVFVVATARHQVSPLVRDFEPNHPEPGRHQNDSRQQRGFGRTLRAHCSKVSQETRHVKFKCMPQ